MTHNGPPELTSTSRSASVPRSKLSMRKYLSAMPLEPKPQFFRSLSFVEPSSCRTEQSLNAVTWMDTPKLIDFITI